MIADLGFRAAKWLLMFSLRRQWRDDRYGWGGSAWTGGRR